MTTEPGPALTSQRSRNRQIPDAIFCGVLALAVVYCIYLGWQQYFTDPTSDNLFIAVLVSPSVIAVYLLLQYFVVPRKVEFFENYLVERSLRGYSRKRSYQEIIKLEVFTRYVACQVFVIRFRGGGDIKLYNDEIHFDELAGWLEERGVPGVQAVKKAIFRHDVLDRLHSKRKSSRKTRSNF